MKEKSITNKEKKGGEQQSIEALEKISNSSYMIVLGNPVLNAKFDLTAFQMKLFHFLVLNTNQSLEGFTVTKVKVSEVANFLKNKTSDYLYNLLEKESRKLLKKEIYWEDEHSWKAANILAQIEYHKKEGAFSFMFPPMLGTHLLRLKKNFTYIDVRNIVSMDSVYAIRFYGFCKEFERFGRFQFTVEEIRKMFNLENKYELYGLFKQKVIVKAQDELIKNSDLIFDFEEIKEGRKVVSLLFFIHKNKQKPRIESDATTGTETTIEEAVFEIVESVKELSEKEKHQEELYQRVIGLQISREVFADWLTKYPTEQIEAGVTYVLDELQKGVKVIKNVPAYLAKMVATESLIQTQKASSEKVQQQKEVVQRKQEELQQELIHKQEQGIFQQKVYNEKKEAVLHLLMEQPVLCQEVLSTLESSIFTQLYVDSYSRKYGTNLSAETFIAFFQEDMGFETVVIATLESKQHCEALHLIKQKYADEAKQLGVSYY